MCMEDERIGRALSPAAGLVSVGNATPAVIAPADPNRVRLVISADGVTVVYVAPEGITPANLSGFALTAGEPILVVDSKVWGKLAAGRWTAIAAAGTVNVAVMTATLDKQ